MPTLSYRHAIATAVLAASLITTLTLGACGQTTRTGRQGATPTHTTATVSTIGTDGDRYSRVCRVPTEDSPIPHWCHLDPAQRYDYAHGAWRATNRASAPTGRRAYRRETFKLITSTT